MRGGGSHARFAPDGASQTPRGSRRASRPRDRRGVQPRVPRDGASDPRALSATLRATRLCDRSSVTRRCSRRRTRSSSRRGGAEGPAAALFDAKDAVCVITEHMQMCRDRPALVQAATRVMLRLCEDPRRLAALAVDGRRGAARRRHRRHPRQRAGRAPTQAADVHRDAEARGGEGRARTRVRARGERGDGQGARGPPRGGAAAAARGDEVWRRRRRRIRGGREAAGGPEAPGAAGRGRRRRRREARGGEKRGGEMVLVVSERARSVRVERGMGGGSGDARKRG